MKTLRNLKSEKIEEEKDPEVLDLPSVNFARFRVQVSAKAIIVKSRSGIVKVPMEEIERLAFPDSPLTLKPKT